MESSLPLSIIGRLVTISIGLVAGSAMLYVSIMILRNGYLYFEEPHLGLVIADLGVSVIVLCCALYLLTTLRNKNEI